MTPLSVPPKSQPRPWSSSHTLRSTESGPLSKVRDQGIAPQMHLAFGTTLAPVVSSWGWGKAFSWGRGDCMPWWGRACACMLSCFSCVRLFVTPWTVALQAPLSMGFPRQQYWSGLPLPPPRDLPDPGIEPVSLESPALTGGFFTTSISWETQWAGNITLFPGSVFPAAFFCWIPRASQSVSLS